MTNIELVQTVELSSAASAINITNIPQDGKSLIIKMHFRGTYASAQQPHLLRFNSDTGNNYDRKGVRVSNGYFYWLNTGISFGAEIYAPSANAATGLFSTTEIQINNYTTSNEKTVWVFNGSPQNSTTTNDWFITNTGVRYFSTSAIDEINITPNFGTIDAGSLISIYKTVAS